MIANFMNLKNIIESVKFIKLERNINLYSCIFLYILKCVFIISSDKISYMHYKLQ